MYLARSRWRHNGERKKVLAERRVLQEIQLCYVGKFYVKADV